MSFRDIGKELGISHESARLACESALRKLRAALEGSPGRARHRACSACGELGHNRSTCKLLASACDKPADRPTPTGFTVSR